MGSFARKKNSLSGRYLLQNHDLGTIPHCRQFLQSRITSVRSKIHHILSNYNADRKDLFSAQGGPAYFKEVPLGDADRFVIKQLWVEWQEHVAQREALTKKLKAFVAKAPQRKRRIAHCSRPPQEWVS